MHRHLLSLSESMISKQKRNCGTRQITCRKLKMECNTEIQYPPGWNESKGDSILHHTLLYQPILNQPLNLEAIEGKSSDRLVLVKKKGYQPLVRLIIDTPSSYIKHEKFVVVNLLEPIKPQIFAKYDSFPLEEGLELLEAKGTVFTAHTKNELNMAKTLKKFYLKSDSNETFQYIKVEKPFGNPRDYSTEPRYTTCDICDKKFSNSSNMNKHRRNMHQHAFTDKIASLEEERDSLLCEKEHIEDLLEFGLLSNKSGRRKLDGFRNRIDKIDLEIQEKKNMRSNFDKNFRKDEEAAGLFNGEESDDEDFNDIDIVTEEENDTDTVDQFVPEDDPKSLQIAEPQPSTSRMPNKRKRNLIYVPNKKAKLTNEDNDDLVAEELETVDETLVHNDPKISSKIKIITSDSRRCTKNTSKPMNDAYYIKLYGLKQCTVSVKKEKFSKAVLERFSPNNKDEDSSEPESPQKYCQCRFVGRGPIMLPVQYQKNITKRMKICKCPRVDDEEDSDTSLGSELSLDNNVTKNVEGALMIVENQVVNDPEIGVKNSRNDLMSFEIRELLSQPVLPSKLRSEEKPTRMIVGIIDECIEAAFKNCIENDLDWYLSSNE